MNRRTRARLVAVVMAGVLILGLVGGVLSSTSGNNTSPSATTAPLVDAPPLSGYVGHYNRHRPNRSLDQQAPGHDGDVTAIPAGPTIAPDTTCGRLINEYRTAA